MCLWVDKRRQRFLPSGFRVWRPYRKTFSVAATAGRSQGAKPATFTQAAGRAQIVAAAIDVIAEIGWSQTSIRKIADRVGVAMSAVLYHFGTKDSLVDAIIEEMYRTAL